MAPMEKMRPYKVISLFTSLTIATALYGLLIYVAPQIMLLTANAKVSAIDTSYNVEIINLPTPQLRKEQADNLNKPEKLSIPDFQELFPSLEEALDATVPESQWTPETFNELNNQIENSDPDRTYDLNPEQQLFKGVDAQILEISESVARDNIDIARRMVRPSPTASNSGGDIDALFRSSRPQEQLAFRPPPQQDVSLDPPTAAPLINDDAMKAIDSLQDEMIENEFLDTHSIEPSPFTPDENEFEIGKVILQERITKEIKHDNIEHMVKLNIRTYIQPDTNQGYFRISIFPNDKMDIQTLPRDITFVIDTSNSILQRKLDSTLTGVLRGLGHLKPSDRFNIVIFRDRAIFLSPDYLPVTPESIEAADKFLTGLKSQGSTDVYNALVPVFEVPTRPGLPAIIIFISDGRPSAGSLSGRALINAISDANSSRHSIFTFGTGKTVNNYLLDLLAYRNKSESNVSTRIEDIESLIPTRLQQLNQPYLVNIKGQFNTLNESTIFPKEIPDFYNEKEVILYGRFNPEIDNDLTLQLTGESGSQSKSMLITTNINSGLKGNSSISRNWANAKVYHLINQVSKYGETPELMSEIQSLNRRYGLKNAYTID